MSLLLQVNFWQQLKQWDQWWFMKLNNDLTNPVFDSIMRVLCNGSYWAPLYLFLAVFVLLNFKGNGGWWILFFACTIAITDMGSTWLFNSFFDRLRPCRDTGLLFQVRLLLKQCPPGSGFISNDAANYFSMAAFFFITFRPMVKKWLWIGFVWAGLIAYAQVYTGVNYPLSVLAGVLFGLTVGLLSGKLFNKRHGFIIFGNQPVA
ncbi:MAG: phosphatase PAP2 family protein [Bacteroidota bacterium]|nr:phosphatase PAP2 family protein [Bacteroidota bacterium]